MQEYMYLIELGFIAIIILLLGLLFRIIGIRFTPSKKRGRGKGGSKSAQARRKRAERRRKGSTDEEEELFFKQAAYIGDGNGPTEFEDADLYAMKEKQKKLGPIDMDDEKEDEEKYESWDDY